VIFKLKKAGEEFLLRNSAKIALQLLTTNTTVRKINNEVYIVPFAQECLVKSKNLPYL
jgi:hypothetical protein